MRTDCNFLARNWNPALSGAFDALVFLGVAQAFENLDPIKTAAYGAISGMLSLPLLALADHIHCVRGGEEQRAAATVTAYVGLSLCSSIAIKGVINLVGWNISYPVACALSGLSIAANLFRGAIYAGGIRLINACATREEVVPQIQV